MIEKYKERVRELIGDSEEDKKNMQAFILKNSKKK
jgi:hypothetical protein